MRRKTGVFSLATAWALSGALALGLSSSARAQESNTSWLDDGDTRRVNIRDVQAQSRFRLFGEGDRAYAGLRSTGNMEQFVTNTGLVDAADMNFDSQPDISGCPNCGGGVINQWFDVSPLYAAPREDWQRFIEDVPSLLNAAGQGYSVAYNAPTLGFREINASDLQFGNLFSGATTTTDGGCQDFSGPNPSGNQASAGVTLLAISNCIDTWPIVNGVPTFLGDNVITAEAFLNAQAALGSDFNFDWWRVDPADIDPNAFFGNIQTYGAYDDYNSALIGRFGNVVPGGSGPPEDPGWPMGIRTEFNAFNFALPTVANTFFWRSLIINRSEDIYGVGLDFENLYIGYSSGPIRNQESSFYFEAWRGAILTAESNTGTPACQGSQAPGVGNNSCGGRAGFNAGATGLIVLKSPIGDLRNVLLSCNTSEAGARLANRAIPCTTDDFFDPGNPHAGDTITYNHYRMCDFGGCTNQAIQVAENQWFGTIASNTELTLNGRAPGTLPARDLYNTFKNPNFPDEPVPYAFWVPGDWDYTANGETPGGDTLFVPTCWGPPGTGREARQDACVVTWADTMPNDPLSPQPAYHNEEGNIAFGSLGPFQLAAGDTAGYVIAMVAGIDSASFESEVNNAISLYMNFFLAPTPPPPSRIVGAEVNPVDPATGANPTATLFLNDIAEEWTDEFLVAFANNQLAAGATPRLARINALNPDLVDRILARAEDNVEELLIFKSCDGGGTFTTDDTDGRGFLDCDADPAVDPSGNSIDVGWQSYTVLAPDGDGEFPNQFVDQNIIPGQQYLYVVLGRTRGAQFAVVDSVDTDGDDAFDALAPDSLLVAPSLLNPLATSPTEPNVLSLYIPTSIQSGGSPSTAELVEGSLPNVDRDAQINFAGDVVNDTYELFFGNNFIVNETVDPVTAEITNTEVTVQDIVRAQTAPGVAGDVIVDEQTFTSENPNGVTENLEDNPLGFVLVRQSTGEPLLVSDVLDGSSTTPSDFFNREGIGSFTGFPGFVVNVDNEDAGQFEQQFWGATQDLVATGGAQPTPVWNVDNSSVATPQFKAFGKYELTWTGRVFGPGEPFTLNLEDPDVTQDAFVASLAAREAGTVTRVDEAAASLLGVSVDDLVAQRVPFSARNVTFDREVSLVALRSQPRNILLGNPNTGDTITVAVPADEWIPGDGLAFIETVTFDSTVSILRRPAFVLDGEGNKVQTTREAVTFPRATIDCGTNPRPTCNPVTGNAITATGPFISSFTGQVLSVFYKVPFEIETKLAFDVTGRVAGQDIIASDRSIQAQLDSVKAVPNPYLMFSRYELDTPQENDARLMFTHLPPQGVLRIFTVSGQFVQELTWGPDDLAGNGDLFWDMRTREGNEAAGGLYVFVVTARNPETGGEAKKIGKFVIIR